MIRIAFLLAALSLSACAAPPKRHYYPPRTKCPPLATLPNPATDADKDAWIADTTDKYSKCAASRRVFIRGSK